jgi:hypothetical protein
VLVGALLLMVAVTGLLLIHAAQFDLEEGAITQAKATVPVDLLKTPDAGALAAALRSGGAVLPGVLDAFEVEDESVRLVFRSPGCVAEARIRRENGQVELETESRGTVGKLLDLHRGKNTGASWRHLMDIMAALLAFSALTGIVLGLALPKRRVLTLVLLVVGTALSLGAYFFLVP